MNKSLSLLLTILILSSCTANKIDVFRAKLFNNWISAFEIRIISNATNTDKVVVKPPYSWVPLFESTFYVDGSNKTAKQCLLYKTPFKTQLGQVKVIDLKENELCEQILDVDNSLENIFLDDVNNFKIYFVKNTLRLKFEFNSKQTDLEFPMYNLKSRPVFKHLKEVEFGQILNGVTLLGKKTGDVNHAKESQRPIGNFDDRYSDGSAKKCVTDSCNECRYGSFETLNGTKFCGINRCGQKNEPACFRGLKYKTYTLEKACMTDSPVGFCKKGLSVNCDNKKNLVCN